MIQSCRCVNFTSNETSPPPPPPYLFQVEVDVAAGDGGIGDELKELAQSHRRYPSLQEKV